MFTHIKLNEKSGSMKKLFAILLSCCLLFGTASYAYAADGETTEGSGQVTPVVIVPGLGSSPIYLNPNTDEQSSFFKFDFSFVKLLWKSHITRTTLSVCRGANVDVNKYIDKLQMVIEPFLSMACDDNGDPVENSGVDCYWTDSLANHLDHLDSKTVAEPAVCKGICDRVGAENVYLFNYDFRTDIVDHAIDLNDFIDNVKDQTGSDKVTLVSASLGTSIVSAYIDMYKDKDDIKRTVFLDGAYQGVAIAQLFGKDIYIDRDVVLSFIDGLVDSYKGSDINFETIRKWINRFDGTVDHVIEFFQKMAGDEYVDRLYTDVLLPIVGNMPSLWECIPYDYFDISVETMTANGWLKEGTGIYDKIMRYHDIQGRLSDNLNELIDNGVEVAIVCGYGYPGMPCTSDYGATSDMLIETKYESIGATCAEYGSELSEDEINDSNYLSGDGMIDASTGLLPDSTWYCKYVQHMQFVYDTGANDFICDLVTTDSDLTISSIKEETGYGQFTEINEENNLVNIE